MRTIPGVAPEITRWVTGEVESRVPLLHGPYLVNRRTIPSPRNRNVCRGKDFQDGRDP